MPSDTLFLELGSPPRGRGKANRHSVPSCFTGITPAWAGKSYCPATRSFWSWDHPRVGGEKPIVIPCRLASRGSPPRGRGKGQLSVGHQIRERITSAWAGKSSWTKAISTRTLDHPRMGGEKYDCTGQEFTNWGSPPRRRGKGGKSFTGNMFTRITPAWAGKRGRFAERKAPSWDHPRMGGEKKKSRRCCTSIGGSPPHGRGKARHLSHGLLPCG